jgi:hypothetical protein
MIPVVSAAQKARGMGTKRSPSGHDRSAITIKNYAGTMKNNTARPVLSILPRTHEKIRRGRPPGHQTQSWITNFFFQIR